MASGGRDTWAEVTLAGVLGSSVDREGGKKSFSSVSAHIKQLV